MEKITVIQGDTLSITLTLEEAETFNATNVYFSCNALDIKREFDAVGEEDELWAVSFTPAETKNFRLGEYCYDVTVVLEGGAVYTVLHDEPIEVLKKVNKWTA